MIDKTDRATSPLTSAAAVEKLVQKRWPGVLFYPPDGCPDREDMQKASIVITTGDPALLETLAGGKELPDYTPILFLGSEDLLPEFVERSSSDRLIDYLSLPVLPQVLFHRISFLARIQRISAEHFINRTTLSRQLNLLSTRDGLTGLFNRRHLTNRLMAVFKQAAEEKTELTLLLLDIDYFSSINRTWGLDFGDKILNELAARLTELTDKNASCYRFSGEEFIVLLPDADLEEGLRAAAKIRNGCSKKPFTDGKNNITLTISVGITSLREHRPATHNQMISMAESALHMAKAEGRNRLQVYISEKEQQVSSEVSLALLKENLSRILEKTKSSAIASLQLLAKNIAGPSHQDHIDNVSNYVALLGEQLGLPEQHTRTFQNSITLYNSFRFLLHNGLLEKPGRLTSGERKLMKDLPFKLNELTDMFDYFAEERNVLLGHNERYDGSGYPLGLRGDEISLGARIFNLVDALAAMNSERPYRRRLTAEEIIEELKKGAGKQFDPYLVLQILTVIKNKKLLPLDPSYLERVQRDLINIFPHLIT